jgi:hypothetical protein
MSRLDSFIRRLEAQRVCLNHAAALIRDLPGPILELGLGNGRTYHHLCVILPDRAIFAFDRELAAHPGSIPPKDRLILGDLMVTLAEVNDRFRRSVALAHLDFGTGDAVASGCIAQRLTADLAPLIRPGGVIVSEPALEVSGWNTLPLPAGVEPGRYHLYQAGFAAS